MKIVAFGDSFTYGEELEDRNHAWPMVLAYKLGTLCINHGEPGTSNRRIISNIFRHITDPHDFNVDDVLVIGWSSPGRTNHADLDGDFDIWPGCNPIRYQKYQPWRQALCDYNDQYHDAKWLLRNYVQDVILTQSLLKSLGIRYVMCNILENEYYKNLFQLPAYAPVDLVDTSSFIGWRQSGMIEWVGKVPKGPGGHFLEQGHQIVADRFYKFIKEKQWQQ